MIPMFHEYCSNGLNKRSEAFLSLGIRLDGDRCIYESEYVSNAPHATKFAS